MTPAARLASALDVFTEIYTQKLPAKEVLKEWGRNHRFAGSKDRHSIASFVYDALRVQASSSWIMGEETPRAILLGSLRERQGLTCAQIADLCSGQTYGLPPLSEKERIALEEGTLDQAPDPVRGNYPAWLQTSFLSSFGADAFQEGRALSERAPVDLRVNILRMSLAKAEKKLRHLHPLAMTYSPWGLRLWGTPCSFNSKERERDSSRKVESEPLYVQGKIAIQDESSQMVALFTDAQPHHQVLDFCAGSGGKTLALAAAMQNRGQIYAHDTGAHRLAPLFTRLQQAHVRNVQVRLPKNAEGEKSQILEDILGRCDRVLIDAPCTGTGVWRRKPDAKWRLRESTFLHRQEEQREILKRAALFVKKGGQLIYATCSVLKEENEDIVRDFLQQHPRFSPLPIDQMLNLLPASQAKEPSIRSRLISPHGVGLRFSPHKTGTDGFYIASLVHNGVA